MAVEDHNRERRLRLLADQLFFSIEEHGGRFTLLRDVDVPAPVWHEDLSIEEAEEVLNSWKLRGFHGG